MKDTKTFKSYNFVTGAVDGTLAYDFGSPRFYPQEEAYEAPARRPKLREQEWIREDVRERSEAKTRRQGVPLLALLGAACAVMLIIMMLLAQIQLVNISSASAALEAQIAELELERDKLTVEYETVFNLKDVEEYAVGVLGMQEPREDQIYYLTNVASADKAVIIPRGGAGALSLGLEDLLGSFKAYFD